MCRRTSSQRCWSAGSCSDQLPVRLIDCRELAEIEFAEDGENLSVKDGCTGGTADGVVREQGELPIEEAAGAQATDSGCHAITAHEVKPWLRTCVFRSVLDGEERCRGQMQAVEAASAERLEA